MRQYPNSNHLMLVPQMSLQSLSTNRDALHIAYPAAARHYIPFCALTAPIPKLLNDAYNTIPCPWQEMRCWSARSVSESGIFGQWIKIC